MPMSPDEQEWFNQLFQGNPEMMPQGGGPPGMGGLEICRMLREQGNQIPILMLTSKV